MTHASVRGTELAVPENVVRLSVGIEDAADLIDDVLGALDRSDVAATALRYFHFGTQHFLRYARAA